MDETAHYSQPFTELLANERLNSLVPGAPNLGMRPRLDALRIETAFEPRTVRDPDMARCCLAAVWLYHDFFDESHRISQGIATTSGNYWHGILHRREPDAWNAKYWFKRVGSHPVFPEVTVAARELAQAEPPSHETEFLLRQTAWDPFAFIDLCDTARLGHTPAEPLCRRIQLAEWRILFDYCYRRAVGD
ncbi:hypothetical protein [Methylococcus capsulatus]|jgi:hypothetical protein|uniref:Uncharacterized protein n=1 Tax=Methylococcus capsulatus TaxID=414 RepID=A0AA35UIW3_METCP|nr:hypothetical protein [Methylococcus capsulatus]CAI8747075.1 conserved protein of unknown function [Methylococcus capsulatus]